MFKHGVAKQQHDPFYFAVPITFGEMSLGHAGKYNLGTCISVQLAYYVTQRIIL